MAASREFLWLVKESALLTPMASPVAGTDSIYVRLTEGNAFEMQTHPLYEEIAYGGGFATTADIVSDHYECKGSLKTNLYPTQAKFFMDWACTNIDSGQTAPWVTTEPPGDLASVSAYHGIQRSDGTILRKRFGGVKVATSAISVNRDGTTAKLNLSLVGCKSFGNAFEASADPDATEFPAPADSDFPTGPYTFKQTAGFVTIGSVRVGYENLDISFQNKLDGRWFETSSLQVLQFCGRASQLEAVLRFKPTPDDRSALESIAAQACSVAFHNGVTGQNMTLQFNGKNYITDLPYDLPLDKVFTVKMTLKNAYDLSAGNDISVSFA